MYKTNTLYLEFDITLPFIIYVFIKLSVSRI